MTKHWTSQEICTLKEMWSDGHFASAIGEAVGRTKNSVISKARSLGLEARPSPIGRVGPSGRKKRLRHKEKVDYGAGTMLRDLPKFAEPPARKGECLRPIAGGCQWIVSEPTADDACKCAEPSLPNSPYCAEHTAQCYNKRPRPSEEARQPFSFLTAKQTHGKFIA